MFVRVLFAGLVVKISKSPVCKYTTHLQVIKTRSPKKFILIRLFIVWCKPPFNCTVKNITACMFKVFHRSDGTRCSIIILHKLFCSPPSLCKPMFCVHRRNACFARTFISNIAICVLLLRVRVCFLAEQIFLKKKLPMGVFQDSVNSSIQLIG